MNEMVLQWLMVVVAIAIGWVLGLRSSHRTKTKSRMDRAVLEEKMQLLYNSYSDDSLENLVNTLPVSKETLSLHLSIAGHFRKKGEVDRSIKVHQNLLSHPGVQEKSVEEVTYELAKDYMFAGLLDRAEALLQKLQLSPNFSIRAIKLLLEIYTQEQEWPKAIELAQKLIQLKEPLHEDLVHFYCELAQEKLTSGDIFEAEQLYRKALDVNRGSIRPHLAYSDLLIKRGAYKEAVSYLQKAAVSDGSFMSELIPRFLSCAEALKEENRFRRYLIELQNEENPSFALGWAESLRRDVGVEEAEKYLAKSVLDKPKLVTLDKLLDYRLDMACSHTDLAFLAAVKQVTTALLKESPRYRCSSCGYSGRKLNWLCPSCKQWGKIRPVKGVSGF